jgi:hypothetical protein
METGQEVRIEKHHPDLSAIIDTVEINALGLLSTRDPSDPEGEARRQRELYREMIKTIA